MSYTLHSPLSVQVSKNKDLALNLNAYRNAHYQVLNNAKIAYANLMVHQVRQLPKIKKCSIEYVAYPKDKRKFDLDNISSIHKKFFQDCLVHFKKLPDDDYRYIICSSERFGSVDKENPRIEIIITEVK